MLPTKINFVLEKPFLYLILDVWTEDTINLKQNIIKSCYIYIYIYIILDYYNPRFFSLFWVFTFSYEMS